MAKIYTFGRQSGLLAAALLGLGGCAVYVPTVPATPLVAAHEVEVSASVRGAFSSLEAGAAWSPANHLLLSGEVAYQGSNGSFTTNNVTTTYTDYHRQVGLGVGVYRAPTATSAYYLAALGGVGFASVNLHSIDVGVAFILPYPYISGFYEAQYQRYYGQLYLAHPLSPQLLGGVSVRGTYVNYSRLTVDGNAIVPTNTFFLEPTFFLRLGHGPVQGQATLGLSVPTQSRPDVPWNRQTAPVSGLTSLGIVLRPALLFHHK